MFWAWSLCGGVERMIGRLWRWSLAPAVASRQDAKGTRLRAVPRTGVKGARVHDDPSTDQPSSFLVDPNDPAVPALTESPRSQLPLGDHGMADRICPFLRAASDGDALG